uniref:Uncharacterized protein n=1 Tax=Melanopsichium pennsylvanicum 4 TaxID=1398559 RepID=A0A077RB40_9BASI|nr:conserved hypothetical protein [Melanopsichium pennsylvanicum 4]
MVVPSEAQIVDAVKTHLKISSADDPDFARLLATLELENDWTDVSAKKFQSILTKNNILSPPSTSSTTTAAAASNSGGGGSKKKNKSKTSAGVPKSFIDDSISIPAGIRGVYFDSVKGKGLVSTRKFTTGELLFTEQAYIATPPPEALDQVCSGELCAQCFLPVSSAPVQLAIKNCKTCKYRFCTSACHQTAMATHHGLLCTGGPNGQAVKQLMQVISGSKWQSLHCVARSLARLLMSLTPYYNNIINRSASNKSNNVGAGRRKCDESNAEDMVKEFGDFETIFSRLSSFATVSELERRTRNPGWTTEKESFTTLLNTAHEALRAALDPYHPSRTISKDLTNHNTTITSSTSSPFVVDHDLIYKVKSRKSQIKDLFDPNTFLKLIGKANINMEKFGGLCTNQLEKIGLQYNSQKLGVKAFLQDVANKSATTVLETNNLDNLNDNNHGKHQNLEEELRASLGF